MDIADLLFSAKEIQRAIYITPAYTESTALQYSSRILLNFPTNSNKCCAPTLHDGEVCPPNHHQSQKATAKRCRNTFSSIAKGNCKVMTM